MHHSCGGRGRGCTPADLSASGPSAEAAVFITSPQSRSLLNPKADEPGWHGMRVALDFE
jgi:hypothetical protein